MLISVISIQLAVAKIFLRRYRMCFLDDERGVKTMDVIADCDVFAITTSYYSTWRFIPGYAKSLFINNLSPNRFVSSRQWERAQERERERTSRAEKQHRLEIASKWLYLCASRTYRITCFASCCERPSNERTKEQRGRTEKNRRTGKSERESNLQLSYVRRWDNYRPRDQSSRDIEFLRCLPWRYFLSPSNPPQSLSLYEGNEMESKKDRCRRRRPWWGIQARTHVLREVRTINTHSISPHALLSSLSWFTSLSFLERGYP